MNSRVAVTGMGIISSIGNNVGENYKALKSKTHGISFPQVLHTRHTHLPVGEIKITNQQLIARLELEPGKGYTRAALLGVLAAREAIRQANIFERDLRETAFISGTSVGGMDMTETYFREFQNPATNKEFIRAQHPGFTTSKIAGALGIQGYTTTISTACSSSANALMLGARLIKAGKFKKVVVGGTDCLTKFTLNGFNSLKILSAEPCMPFDEGRTGLNLGEGAAYLVLEAIEDLKEKPVLGILSGYGNANDAFHQTASSKEGEGAYRAMDAALKIAALNAGQIDCINAHGTGTRNNDASEAIALQRIFGNSMPPLSSTKAFTGHTLAAAGAVEAVFSLLSLQNNQVFANLNFQTPIDGFVLPVTKTENMELNNIISNSLGFGGNCTSLIFSKYEN